MPFLKVLILGRRILLAQLITEECLSCGACVSKCPTRAIHRGDVIYEVNPYQCNDCSDIEGEPLCHPVCPVDAFELSSDIVVKGLVPVNLR